MRVDYCVLKGWEDTLCIECYTCWEEYMKKSGPVKDDEVFNLIKQTSITLKDMQEDVENLFDIYHCLIHLINEYPLSYDSNGVKITVNGVIDELVTIYQKIKRINEEYQKIQSLIKEQEHHKDNDEMKK